MRPYKNRVLIVCLVLVIAFAAVFFRLDSMMIDGQEASTARATSRSTKTLSVTGMRGTIYDVNMTPLAYDRRSYNVTFYRDPSRSSEADRKTYTRSILKTIQLVESNGKSTITEFWLKKDEDGVWRFSTNSTSESVNATRESQWRANFYLTSTPEEQLFDALLEKYLIRRRSARGDRRGTGGGGSRQHHRRADRRAVRGHDRQDTRHLADLAHEQLQLPPRSHRLRRGL